jgi:hypothetical protein
MDRALRGPYYGTHFTKKTLTPDRSGAVALFSREKLLQRRISFDHGNTMGIDREVVGNDDSVFFSLEPGETPQKQRSRFGPNRLRVPLNQPVFQQTAWLSLKDMAVNLPAYYRKLPWLTFREQRLLTKKGHGPDHVFFGKDMIPGMLLTLISDARELGENSRKQVLNAKTDEDINTLINGFYKPEIKVPKQLITTEFVFDSPTQARLSDD